MARNYTLLVIGGSSAIALAYVRQRLETLRCQGSILSVVLLGRDAEKLQAEKQDLMARGANVAVVVGDLAHPGSIEIDDDRVGAVDEAILAYGVLTDQQRAQSSDGYLQDQIATNFTSAAVWLEKLACRFEAQGCGKAVVIGSVAGDRGRQSNYAYGAAKAGLDTYVAGLQHRFGAHADIHFTLIKPGFVDTPMTVHIEPKGFLWANPEQIAKLIEKAVARRALVAYTPWFWRWIMLLIRFVPAFLFHKTKL